MATHRQDATISTSTSMAGRPSPRTAAPPPRLAARALAAAVPRAVLATCDKGGRGDLLETVQLGDFTKFMANLLRLLQYLRTYIMCKFRAIVSCT